MNTKTYSFRAKLWKFKGPNGWSFVTLPKSLAARIRKHHGLGEEGWGRLPTTAQIEKSSWATAIWYDSKAKSYLLPIKAQIRKAQKLEYEKMVSVKLLISVEDPRISLFERKIR